MAKLKSLFVCSQCGYESAKWYGKCPGCGEWNTMTEEPVAAKGKSLTFDVGVTSGNRRIEAVKIGEIKAEDLPRIKLPSAELNRVLGGGFIV